MENQTILVLRAQRMLQTFGENLIIQVLRKIMVMALPKSSGGVMAPSGCWGERMKIILKALRWHPWRWQASRATLCQVFLEMAM